MIAYTYPLADLFGTMLGLFVFFIWFWLLIVVFSDIFRSQRPGRRGQDAVGPVRHHPPLPRHLRLPDRSGGKDARAGRGPGRSAAEVLRRLRQEDGGQPEPARRNNWHSWPTSSKQGRITDAEFEAQKQKILA